MWCHFRQLFPWTGRSAKHAGILINSEGFLAEIFHPWVRWEGPGSGFENSSGAGAGGAGGVWAQARAQARAQAWAQARTQGPLGIEVEKQGFRTAWLITGRKFP